MTAIENKTANINSLVKKNGSWLKNYWNWKITDHNNDKYITALEFNTLAADVFNTRLAQANSVTKTDFDNNVSSLDNKIAANKTKNESIKNEFKKLKTFPSSYFIGKDHFEEVGKQNYLVFQPLN